MTEREAETPSRRDQVLVVIPAFNEESTVGAVIREVLALGPGFVPVVIDDGSTDRTARRAAEHGARLVSLPMNLGIGGAVQTGIQLARQDGFGFCCQIDGDGQHIAAELLRLVEKQRRDGDNIVIGSRYIPGAEGDRSTRMRRLGSRIISLTISIVFRGARVSDPTSGLRLLDRRAILLFASDYPHDYPEPISVSVAIRNGLSVADVPVSMRARSHGQSSIGGIKNLLYMFRVICYIVLARCRPPREGKE
jgi:glycosyltransferase involved in cell wall biosynthesis